MWPLQLKVYSRSLLPLNLLCILIVTSTNYVILDIIHIDSVGAFNNPYTLPYVYVPYVKYRDSIDHKNLSQAHKTAVGSHVVSLLSKHNFDHKNAECCNSDAGKCNKE